MRILLWHVHGGWTDAFVRGPHEYLLPVDDDRGPLGLGRGGRDWPDSVREVAPLSLADEDVDVVVLQRPEEIAVAELLTGRRPGRDVAAVYVEHNTPKGGVPDTRHPLADRSDIPLVHVTHFNRLIWDSGKAPTIVVEHGVVDPGPLYTGELARAAVVANEPIRRWRVTGTDLIPRIADAAPVDVFGMGADGLGERLSLPAPALRTIGDLPTPELHAQLALRRVYVHPVRWTSLGLSLIEAMHIGMPVAALATTEAPRAVPPEAGVVTNDLDALVAGVRAAVDDPDLAAEQGRAAREFALAHHGLAAFHDRWDTVLADLTPPKRRRRTGPAAAHDGRNT